MKDKRIDKIKQHFDLFLNDRKFKVISYKIDEDRRILSIKTKIFGQDFPRNGHFVITVPAENISQAVHISFHGMLKTPAIEEWLYEILSESLA